MEQLVIDTNVLVAALMSRRGTSFQLISTIDTGLFAFHLSVPLVLEYEAVCKRHLGTKIMLSEQDIDDLIDYLCSVGQHHQVYYLWRPFLDDPRDEMILELAVTARCKWIVTFNKADFRRIERFGVQAVTPVELLKHIGILP